VILPALLNLNFHPIYEEPLFKVERSDKTRSMKARTIQSINESVMNLKAAVVVIGTLVGCTIAINDVVLVERQNYTMSNTNDFLGGSVSYSNTDDILTKYV
jgi:hypothetical protein